VSTDLMDASAAATDEQLVITLCVML